MQTSTYAKMNLFPGQIKAKVIRQATKNAIQHMKDDYQTACFMGLLEWRQNSADIRNHKLPIFGKNSFHTVITEDQAFQANIFEAN